MTSVPPTARAACIDGGIRDTMQILETPFPVYYKYRIPNGSLGRCMITHYQVPINLGDALIKPGEVIFADIDGVLCVPRDIAYDLYYSTFGYDKSVEPKLADLDSGFSPEYVYCEAKRYVAGIGHRAKFYAGIGMDIPKGQGWGDKVWHSDPERLALAVRRSFDAGDKGIVISREYEEMTLPSLKVIGKSIRKIAKQQG